MYIFHRVRWIPGSARHFKTVFKEIDLAFPLTSHRIEGLTQFRTLIEACSRTLVNLELSRWSRKLRFPFVQWNKELDRNPIFTAHFSSAPSPTETVTMASLNLIPVSKTVHLGQSIKPDGFIIFRSSQLNIGPTINHTSLNLLSDNSDIVLHIVFRRVENVIGFNASRSGNWFNEEQITFGERLRGHNHTVAIYDHGDNYQILFNGKTGHYFKKPIRAEASSLQYNAGQDPHFSDPIVAETYVNWTALVSGLD